MSEKSTQSQTVQLTTGLKRFADRSDQAFLSFVGGLVRTLEKSKREAVILGSAAAVAAKTTGVVSKRLLQLRKSRRKTESEIVARLDPLLKELVLQVSLLPIEEAEGLKDNETFWGLVEKISALERDWRRAQERARDEECSPEDEGELSPAAEEDESSTNTASSESAAEEDDVTLSGLAKVVDFAREMIGTISAKKADKTVSEDSEESHQQHQDGADGAEQTLEPGVERQDAELRAEDQETTDERADHQVDESSEKMDEESSRASKKTVSNTKKSKVSKDSEVKEEVESKEEQGEDTAEDESDGK